MACHAALAVLSVCLAGGCDERPSAQFRPTVLESLPADLESVDTVIIQYHNDTTTLTGEEAKDFVRCFLPPNATSMHQTFKVEVLSSIRFCRNNKEVLFLLYYADSTYSFGDTYFSLAKDPLAGKWRD